MDVFISYSHKDRDWKERIATFMRCMQIQNRFDYATWDDGEINPGEDWRDHIMNAIDKCKIAVLLVSPDFLASDFILKQEVPRLEKLRDQERVHIVPVIIRPCTWEIVDLLVRLQLHPADGSALSGKSEHGIEEQLKLLCLEVNRLVGPPTVRKTSNTTRGGKVSTSSKSKFRFFTQEQIGDFLKTQFDTMAREYLQIFDTCLQKIWLVRAEDDRLYCFLDSETTQTSGLLDQWRIKLRPGVNVTVRPRSRYKNSGTVDIGKRQNWLYSRKLHPDPQELERKIREMIAV